MDIPAGPGAAHSAFPTPEETLALKASLLQGEAAIEAWRELTARGGIGKGGVGWIAPLLHANLSALLPDDPFVRDNPHYLTLCRLREQATIQSVARTLGLFENASIPTLVLKGLALGASVYAPGLRSISDVDILVPPAQAFAAFTLLKDHGFQPGHGEPLRPADLRTKHAHAFYSSKGHELPIDLHWHVLASARGDAADAHFWSGARPLALGGAATRRLCDEDQLLHALVHGLRWTRSPHVRWAADAALILRHADQTFRPERLLTAAGKFDAVMPVREGLRFVSENLGEGRDLLARVQEMKPSLFSERAFKARATAYEQRTVGDRIAMRIETAMWKLRAHRKNPE